MARTNQWILPIALLVMIVGLAIMFSNEAIALVHRQPAVIVLRVPGNYRTVQAAIDTAKPGDIIQVAPGTYDESLRLNKALYLTAESSDAINAATTKNVVVLTGNPSSPAAIDRNTGFQVISDGCGITIAILKTLTGPAMRASRSWQKSFQATQIYRACSHKMTKWGWAPLPPFVKPA